MDRKNHWKRAKMNYILWIAFLISSITRANAQVCTGRLAGLDGTHTGNLDPDSGRTYLMEDDGGVNCYGVVQEFHFERNNGDCQSITFQIWREVGSPTYQLVGQYDYDGAGDRRCTDPSVGITEVRVLIPVSQQIPVYPNDVIGWRETSNNDMLQHNFAAGNILYDDGCAATNPGANCNFGNAINRAYAIRAYIVQGPLPSIDNLPSTVEVYEAPFVPATIYTVSASHQSNHLSTPNAWDQAVDVTYSLDPAFTAEFTINGNGDVDAIVSFDYEVTPTYDVIVYVDALGLQASGILTVDILDLEEPHIFQNLPHTMALSAQTTGAGDLAYTVVSVDAVTLAPVIVSYFIESGLCGTVLAPFDIDRVSGEVRCTQNLEDFQQTPCILNIASADLINKINDVLTIHITDIKPAPIIVNLAQTIPLPEDVNGNSVIFQVEVDYPDQDQLLYEMINVVPPTYNFEINSANGEISVTEFPVFDIVTEPTYDIDITATNQFGLSDTDTLTVAMVWANQAPYYQPDVYDLIMDEECDGDYTNCPVPALDIMVMNANVEDRDVENGLGGDILACEILPSFGSDKFNSPLGFCIPTGNQVQLWLSARIDLDTEPEYENFDLTLRVQDASSASNMATVHVTVNYINDNAPVFQNTPYGASIFENTPGGVYLFTVSATDADTGIDGVVTYGIQDVGGQPRGTFYFQIDPVTGVVTTKHPIDYEQYQDITFDITATDKGTNPAPLMTTERTTVVIIDVNDNPPEFVCDPRPADEPYDPDPACFYNMELRSDSLVGYEVMQITATDLDQDVTPHYITYEFIKPVDHFVLTPEDGWILVSKGLHTSHKYLLYCFAYDNGIPTLMSTALVVRIDSFKASKHLIDIVLEIPSGDFNQTSVQDGFINELRILLDPWFVKMERYTIDKDKTTVTIYALCDSSSYLYSNIDQSKCFVHRDDLLKKLRKNIFGDPHEDLLTPPFEPYNPILVEPTYPIWIIDTIEGIITLSLICLLFLLLIIGIILCICKKAQICCFKSKPPPTTHNWPKPTSPSPETKPDEMEMEPTREGTPSRRASVDTIHSLIYDPYKNKAV